MRTQVIILAALIGGCGGKTVDQQANVAKPAPVDRTDASLAAPRAVPPISESMARELMTRWLAAQNGGTFSDYEALYAERFTGIKRAGPRTRSFDRQTWMVDRKRMFGAPMEVEAHEIKIEVQGHSALVSFTQTFAKGKFRDQGPKQMVLVATPNGARIAREEMLHSALSNDKAATEIFSILQVKGESYVVLPPETALEATGEFEALGGGDGFSHAGRRKASPIGGQGKPAREFQVYPGGRTCTVDSYYILGVGTPHFGNEIAWDTGDLDGDGVADSAPLSAAEQDEQGVVTDMFAGRLSCEGRVALAAPGIEWKRITEDTIQPAAEKAFARHPLSLEIEKELEPYNAKGPWYSFESSPGVHSVSFESPNGRRIVVVGADVGSGCGDFSGSLFLVFEVKAGKLRPLGTTSGPPEVAVAFDRNSLPFLIEQHRITEPVDGEYGDLRELDLGYRDCPC